jgi:hypothetical protein
MVDLGKRTMVNGAIVHTWQGKGQGENHGMLSNVSLGMAMLASATATKR